MGGATGVIDMIGCHCGFSGCRREHNRPQPPGCLRSDQVMKPYNTASRIAGTPNPLSFTSAGYGVSRPASSETRRQAGSIADGQADSVIFGTDVTFHG